MAGWSDSFRRNERREGRMRSAKTAGTGEEERVRDEAKGKARGHRDKGWGWELGGCLWARDASAVSGNPDTTTHRRKTDRK